MITDSLRAKGCPPGGDYELGGHAIEIGTDGLARLKGTDTIAGSTLRMNQGLRILVEEALVPFDTAERLHHQSGQMSGGGQAEGTHRGGL